VRGARSEELEMGREDATSWGMRTVRERDGFGPSGDEGGCGGEGGGCFGSCSGGLGAAGAEDLGASAGYNSEGAGDWLDNPDYLMSGLIGRFLVAEP
jgi:hypothetical protein